MATSVEGQVLEKALRELASAARSVRLYPPSSPIPEQSALSAVSALAELMGDSQSKTLTVARHGFGCDGQPVDSSAPAVAELAEVLRAHGIASVTVSPGITPDDILSFVKAITRPVGDVSDDGGVPSVLSALGTGHIAVAEVLLSVTDGDGGQQPDVVIVRELETWLQDLSADSDRLSTWFSAATSSDPALFEEGLLELERAAGTLGAGLFDSALAAAFVEQTPGARDVLLSRAMESEPVRAVVARLFQQLPAEQIAQSLAGGVFGKNMLSLSHALTSLPLGKAGNDVFRQVVGMIIADGHTQKDISFLEHMIRTRSRRGVEAPLAEIDEAYRSVADAAAIDSASMTAGREVVVSSGQAVNRAGIRAMLTLLDRQPDRARFCETAEAVACMVPALIEARELGLSKLVLHELEKRETTHAAPWPETMSCIDSARRAAIKPEAMRSLLEQVIADRLVTGDAREIVALLGESALGALIAEAIGLKAQGIEAAERLLGSQRALPLLASAASEVEWHHLEPVVCRLSRERDSACVAAVEAMLARSDVRSRREAAKGLAQAAAPAPSKLLARALADSDRDVVHIVAMGIARCGVPGSADLLSTRIGEINIDGADFEIAKDLIDALAHTPEPAADVALERLASRRSLIKRGHFLDVQAAVAHARQLRTSGGVVQ